jgi:hypothetical protein
MEPLWKITLDENAYNNRGRVFLAVNKYDPSVQVTLLFDHLQVVSGSSRASVLSSTISLSEQQVNQIIDEIYASDARARSFGRSDSRVAPITRALNDEGLRVKLEGMRLRPETAMQLIKKITERALSSDNLEQLICTLTVNTIDKPFGPDGLEEIEELLKTTRVELIEMIYTTYDHSKTIHMRLVEAQEIKKDENFIFISGNTDWAHSVHSQLQERVDRAQKQPKDLTKAYIGISAYGIIAYAICAYIILHSAVMLYFVPLYLQILAFILPLILVSAIVGLLCIYLRSIHKEMEFQFGLPHDAEKWHNKRKYFYFFLYRLLSTGF